MTSSSPTQKCTYSRHSGPAGCLPAPNIFPLEKETFAKAKYFRILSEVSYRKMIHVVIEFISGFCNKV